jgi:soluble lytic murein transglycosylase
MHLGSWLTPFLLAGLLGLAAPLAHGQTLDDTVVQAREALKKKDANALSAARQATARGKHPLAQWVDYWELFNRLADAQQPELDAFYARWSGTYVEDRLRNDWLLELGKRRDWANFRTEFPRFRMNDDREVTCYALLTQHLAGQDVRDAARSAWYAQREQDDGCDLLARTLRDARQLSEADMWQKARLAMDAGRVKALRAAVALALSGADKAVQEKAAQELWDNPVKYLAKRPPVITAARHELELLALMRMASNDADYAAEPIASTWGPKLPVAVAAQAWAYLAKQSALKQLPAAADQARHAWKLWGLAAKPGTPPPWGDDVNAWHARAALRAPPSDKLRWDLLQQAIEALSPQEQRDPTWAYWKARAVTARAAAGPEGDAARAAARESLLAISSPFTFYGQLATEDLGNRLTLPAAPAALTPAEREAPRQQAGFQRALQLIGLGLRNEGVREWNFTLRGLPDRDLLAAAAWACEREVWDRCINTSDRSKTEVDLTQRYPLPHRDLLEAKARAGGLEPAVVYGLIRQESRFITDARSQVGASGLMQLMPATARWTAKQVGLAYTPQQIDNREVNLQLGIAYLKRLVDDFEGSLAMATAGYNAGPGRPRRWREGGAVMEPAAWAESIPFNETRDYVKKVLSNSVLYAAQLAAPGQALPTLKSRLGKAIGPRDAAAPPPDKELP